MNFDKYNPLQGTKKEEKPDPGVRDPECGDPRDLQSLQDSGPVVRLMEYLKKHQDKGISLRQREGRAFIEFEPGLSRKDREPSDGRSPSMF
jgi:hypothetical protein